MRRRPHSISTRRRHRSSSPALPRPPFSGALSGSPDRPYSIPPPYALAFPRIGCGLDIGVEEIPLVEEIALVD